LESHRDEGSHNFQEISKARDELHRRAQQYSTSTKELNPFVQRTLKSYEQEEGALEQTIFQAMEKLKDLRTKMSDCLDHANQLKTTIALENPNTPFDSTVFRRDLENLEKVNKSLRFFEDLKKGGTVRNNTSPEPNNNTPSSGNQGPKPGTFQVVKSKKKKAKCVKKSSDRGPLECCMKEKGYTREQAIEFLRKKKNWKTVLCNNKTKSRCDYPECGYYHPEDFKTPHYCLDCFECLPTNTRMEHKSTCKRIVVVP